MARSKSPPRLLAVALALSALGCGKWREISLCRSVARDANQALDEIEALSKATPVDEPRIAQRYGKLAATLAPRAAGERPLPAALREYIAVLQATETALKNHDAAQKAQSPRLAESRRELERLVKRERAATIRIETECHN